MFHHMGFGKGNFPAGLKSNDIDMHIMAQIGRVNKLRGRPYSICIGISIGVVSASVHKGVRRFNTSIG